MVSAAGQSRGQGLEGLSQESELRVLGTRRRNSHGPGSTRSFCPSGRRVRVSGWLMQRLDSASSAAASGSLFLKFSDTELLQMEDSRGHFFLLGFPVWLWFSFRRPRKKGQTGKQACVWRATRPSCPWCPRGGRRRAVSPRAWRGKAVACWPPGEWAGRRASQPCDGVLLGAQGRGCSCGAEVT